MKTEVHRIVCYVVDHGHLGAEGYKDLLEHTEFPNHAPNPDVSEITTMAINYSENHPINKVDSGLAYCDHLFRKGGEK